MKCDVVLMIYCIVGVVLRWLYQYLGTIEFDPRNELKEIPLHSSFFILAPENK